MSIFIWNSEIKNAYIWTTPVKEIYVGTTKVRPTTPPVEPVDICFWYTWAAQWWTVPSTQEYCIEVWGAQWGNSPSSSYVWWYGWYAAGKICLTEWCKLCIYVGWQPDTCTLMWCYSCWWNWWGCWRVWCYSGSWVYAQWWWGGTDVRYGWTTLCHRFIVAWWGAWGVCGNCQSTNMATAWAWGWTCWCSPAWANWVGKQTAAWSRWSFGQGATWGTDNNYKNHAWWGWGWWYWGGASCCKSDSNKTLQCCAWWGSWYTYTSSTCWNHPNASCLSDLPFMTDAVCCSWSWTIPTPTWWSQTWWQWDWCVRIRSV